MAIASDLTIVVRAQHILERVPMTRDEGAAGLRRFLADTDLVYMLRG